ncbi:hypothetical protein BJ508DRAFT_363586, partial [Ascobolus immersus RN42]
MPPTKPPPLVPSGTPSAPPTPGPPPPRRPQPSRPKVIIPSSTASPGKATISNPRRPDYASSYVSPYRQQPTSRAPSRSGTPTAQSPKVSSMVSKFNQTRDERAPSPQNPLGVGRRRAPTASTGTARRQPELKRPTGLRSSSAMGSYDPAAKDRDARQKQLGVGKSPRPSSSRPPSAMSNRPPSRTSRPPSRQQQTSGRRNFSGPPTTTIASHKRSHSSCEATSPPMHQLPATPAKSAFLATPQGHRRSRSDLGGLRIETDVGGALRADSRTDEVYKMTTAKGKAPASSHNSRQTHPRPPPTTRTAASLAVVVDQSKIPSPKKSPALRSTRGTRLPTPKSVKKPVDFEARRLTIQEKFRKEMDSASAPGGFRKQVHESQEGQGMFVRTNARKSMKAAVVESADPMTPYYGPGEGPDGHDEPVPEVPRGYEEMVTEFEDVGFTEAETGDEGDVFGEEGDTVTERMKRAMDAAVKAELDRALRGVDEGVVEEEVRMRRERREREDQQQRREERELERLHTEDEGDGGVVERPNLEYQQRQMQQMQPVRYEEDVRFDTRLAHEMGHDTRHAPDELRITIEQETEDERDNERRIDEQWTPRPEMEERNSSIFEWKVDASSYISSAGDQTPITPMSAIPLPRIEDSRPSGLAAITVSDMSTPATRTSILPQRGGPSQQQQQPPAQGGFGTPLLEITKMLRPDSIATEWSDFEPTPAPTPFTRTPGRQYKDWAHDTSTSPPLPSLPTQFTTTGQPPEPLTPDDGCGTFMSTRTDTTRRVISAIIGEYGDSPIYSRGSIADDETERDFSETDAEETEIELTRASMLSFSSPA